MSDYYPIPPQPPHLPTLTPTPSPQPLPSPPPFTPSLHLSLHPLLPQVESTPYSNAGVRPIDNSRCDMTLASLPEGFYSGSALHKDGSLLSVWFQVCTYVCMYTGSLAPNSLSYSPSPHAVCCTMAGLISVAILKYITKHTFVKLHAEL